jgi:catechol 2,3-dioxygenase-like lactoylglutathione lyase family enzyme
MTVELDHTIVPAHDPKASAQFLADILGLEIDPPVAHLMPIMTANQVTLDYDQHDHLDSHQYVFLVTDEEFDAAFARIRDAGLTFFADPGCQQAGQIYCSRGRRGRADHHDGLSNRSTA